MQIFRFDTHYKFMSKRKMAALFSAALILISIIAIALRGLNFGIDFTGGTIVEVGYEKPVELPKVREQLAAGGFANASVQHFGTSKDVMVRLMPQDETKAAEASKLAFAALSKVTDGGAAELRRVEFVGPQVGDELSEDGGLAILYTLIGILIYVGLRFESRLAIGAVLALIHDMIITVGVFALVQIEFDLPVLAAMLAVLGYSLNDTIVVYDRLRENFRKIRKGTPLEIADTSLNQTLSRTIVTSMTTLFVLLALFVFGGEIMHGFALALIVGIVTGTYSSIYVASNAALFLGLSREGLMPVQKEGAELDQEP